MSNFYNNLSEYVNNHIREYCKVISQKYNLDEEEIYAIWSGKAASTSSKPSPVSLSAALPVDKKSTPVVFSASATGTSEDDFDLSPQGLNKATKPILVTICKARNLKTTGTKDELKNRILEALGLVESSTANSVKESKKESKEKPDKVVEKVKKPPAKKSSPSKRSPVNKEDVPVRKLVEAPKISVSRNKWGNYEHADSHLVFNPQTQKVFGKQQEDGSVTTLTAEDIEECKRWKFNWELPENLNNGKKEDEPAFVKEDSDEDEQVEDVDDVEEIDEMVEDD